MTIPMMYLTMILALAPSVAAFSGTSASCSSVQRSRRTRLDYRSGTVGGAKSQPDDFLTSTGASSTEPHRGPGWWDSIFNSKGDDQVRTPDQQVDDYLEFLDRRWHRLNDKDGGKEPRFSVLDWLSQGNSADVASTAAEQEEDALHVLGVAGLASQRLLKKHQRSGAFLLKQQKDRQSPSKVPAVDAEVLEKSPAALEIKVPENLKPAVSLLRTVQARRNILVRNQVKSVRLALAYLIKSMMVGPVKAARNLYALGGGKQTVAVTFTAIVAISVVIRPLLRVVVSESLSS